MTNRSRRGAPMPVLALSSAVVALLLGASLSACSSPAAPAAPAASGSAAPPSAEPSALPEETAESLFTVSARARAVDGTTMELSLVAYEPLASTDSDAAALVDDFLSACTELGGRSISDPASMVSEDSLAAFGSSLMRIDFAATPDDHKLVAPVSVIAGIDNYAIIATGEGLQELQTTENCLNRYQLTESGEGSFVADFESGSPSPDEGQWKFGSYGFTVPFESGATLESCRIELSATASAETAGVAGWDADGGGGISCGIGYTGE